MSNVIDLKNAVAPFNVGDVVTLKSDPDVGMTVRAVSKVKVSVDWINGNKDPCESEYFVKQLQLKEVVEEMGVPEEVGTLSDTQPETC
jgi:hypothetical protein